MAVAEAPHSSVVVVHKPAVARASSADAARSLRVLLNRRDRQRRHQQLMRMMTRARETLWPSCRRLWVRRRSSARPSKLGNGQIRTQFQRHEIDTYERRTQTTERKSSDMLIIIRLILNETALPALGNWDAQRVPPGYTSWCSTNHQMYPSYSLKFPIKRRLVISRTVILQVVLRDSETSAAVSDQHG